MSTCVEVLKKNEKKPTKTVPSSLFLRYNTVIHDHYSPLVFKNNMYLIKTPEFIRKTFPGFIWQMPDESQQENNKELYLTFDDGPVQEVTPFVIDFLKQYNAKATFFCVGENIEENPEIFQELKDQGHSIGSHSYNHLSGWATENNQYLSNVDKAAKLSSSTLFRPPYGRIKLSQAKKIQENYKIIMWDVLSGDFDPKISAEKCYDNVVDNAHNGSIVVFHDSQKSYKVLKEVLPRVLDHYSELGYQFKSITEERIAPSLN